MPLRLALLLTALLILPSMVLADGMSTYQDMAIHCGEGPSQRRYSTSQYAEAIGDAQRALRNAGDNNAQRNAVRTWLNNLEECRKTAVTKLPVPPIKNCDELFRETDIFHRRYLELYASKTITDDEYNRARELFREPAKRCARELLSKCIDPTKPSEVDRAIDYLDAIAYARLVSTTAELSAAHKFVADVVPLFSRIKFCSDTDFSCKGDRAACDRRIKRVKEIMDYYFINSRIE